MKKVILLSFILITTTLFAQKSVSVLESEVPKLVVESFHKNIKIDKDAALVWKFSKNINEYSALFYKDALKIESFILADGQFLRTCEDVKLKDIPKKITQYITDKIPDATILSAYKWIRSSGSTYQIKISKEKNNESGRNYTISKNYIFDENANLIRIF